MTKYPGVDMERKDDYWGSYVWGLYRPGEGCHAALLPKLGGRRGADHPRWKGGRSRKGGYILVRNTHPEWRKSFYVMEHIAVWEEANRKRLPKGWHVHHLNGIKDDNRLENLAAMSANHHHSKPREALQPYERRIAELEAQLA